jgi:hypothetical protein
VCNIHDQIRALVRHVLRVTRTDDLTPTKAIVFSLWPQVLMNVALTLSANNVPFVNCAHKNGGGFGEAVDEWKKSETKHVSVVAH